jgi:hypothetical protein
MYSTLFDDIFAALKAMRLSGADVARLRKWVEGIDHPAESTRPIEPAAEGREAGGAMPPRGHTTRLKD